MTSKLRSASLLTAAAVFLFFLPAADTSGCGGGDVIIGDDGGGGAGAQGGGAQGGDDQGGGAPGTGGSQGPGGAGPGCVITGCSSQLCANEEMASTCEYLPEYECYQLYGVCEADGNGVCGWAQNQDLLNCVTQVGNCPAPDEPCMNAGNYEQCLDMATTCSGGVVVLESCPLQFACSE